MTHNLWPARTRAALAEWIAERAGARAASIEGCERLSGGAVHENWGLEVRLEGVAGRRDLVLRADAPSRIEESRPLAQEFALLRAVFAAGVAVPEPLWHCAEPAVIGRPFFLMRRVAGTAVARRVVRRVAALDQGDALAQGLARELAGIHAIVPPRADLAFLGAPSATPALDLVAHCRAYLDRRGEPRPTLEWGLRWLERHAPQTAAPVLAHRDFRTGNYLLDGDRLTAILDWEFAGWSDSMEDLGWFCAKCWRFGAWALEAGGIAPKATFTRAYEAASGRRVDADAVRYWEVMAHVRWAVIALQQADRHLGGGEESLELALLGRRPAELEYEILRLTGAIGGTANA